MRVMLVTFTPGFSHWASFWRSSRFSPGTASATAPFTAAESKIAIVDIWQDFILDIKRKEQIGVLGISLVIGLALFALCLEGIKDYLTVELGIYMSREQRRCTHNLEVGGACTQVSSVCYNLQFLARDSFKSIVIL